MQDKRKTMEHAREQPKEQTGIDRELIKVMADFLEMGHVENIVAMFKQESSYYDCVGELLTDERFAVRLGVSVLFEYLVAERPDDVELAIPSLVAQTDNPNSWVRGEVANVLGIIGSQEALRHVETLVADSDSQVVAVARDVLKDAGRD